MAFELRISYWSSDVCSSDLFYAPYFEISDVGRHGSVGRLIRGRERQANILRVEKLKRILVGCVKSSDVEPAPPISQAEIGLGAHFHVGKFFLARLLERPQVRTGSAWIIATCAAGGEGAFEGGGVDVGSTIAPPTDRSE